MNKTGAWLARYALEQLGIRHTFGIPGVHNTELYDELNKSDLITPMLVTHESGAAFMADGVSRTSTETGTLLIVPAAGVTHASSGIGEAFLDGIPMLVICGGIRTDLPYHNQLHELAQHDFISPLCKQTWRIERHQDIVPVFYAAYQLAHQGEPGPVFVEIPVNIQLLTGTVDALPEFEGLVQPLKVADTLIDQAVEVICSASRVGIFAGWGARDASAELIKLAEYLGAPVATTLQGISVFPANHPLHTGFGIGRSAVPAGRQSFQDCDCLIAIGTKFSEIGTGSFGVEVPHKLVHIDIEASAIGKNYPATTALVGDAKVVLEQLLAKLAHSRAAAEPALVAATTQRIATLKASYRQSWQQHDSHQRINPLQFFDVLRAQIPDDAQVVLDDGNHTFLAAELFPVLQSRRMISPTDFNCMGYAVPAAIGAKIAAPERCVICIAGDGSFAMTAMEIATASMNKLGVIFFVFHDGELGQIAQAQKIPYNRIPCATIPLINYQALATGLGAEYVDMGHADEVEDAIIKALELAQKNQPVVVRVAIDYSKKTAFTEGTVETNFKRFDLATKVRFASRALKRKILG